jgi:hypothetical protein
MGELRRAAAGVLRSGSGAETGHKHGGACAQLALSRGGGLHGGTAGGDTDQRRRRGRRGGWHIRGRVDGLAQGRGGNYGRWRALLRAVAGLGAAT